MDEIMNSWREAFRSASGNEPPEITYSHGWFTIEGMKYRKKEIEDSIKLHSDSAKKRKQAAAELAKILRG